MSKLIKIIVSVVVLSLVYLWMSSFLQSCSNKSSEQESQVEILDDIPEEEIIDVSDDDFFEDDEYLEDTATEESFEELEQNLIEKDPSASGNTDPTPVSKSSNSGGQFMLISGNYLVEANANEMVKKLKNLGYTDAEIVIFDRSQYHTVVASRFSNYDTALQSASMLKQKGVDCYVKKRT